ncbi:hypothetical protein [Cryptosporidium parvum Iowa II]|uniref:Uncharacterized protein n=2 Tax=Cryptosporidium parvum TaxID=5807 RepID=Q5CQ26_CRYPI|nr:hypothetical protein [Cryptosporidium parvum Iowa II]EAK87585.1 hypothetical protein cgd5_4380 [Cryptosporidium parvum Iowa II]QOY41754.1 RmlC-like jelly roll fold containing protein [Cryptosporidium parvum]WKS77975.1 hypothetical protein CPCDC_5g4380 [Cryptosporidium sp. 43IA8]WRK32466.1 RmlC-like jelly roll fold containing protein [Cryptosporidium parvum]|eukprot:QOY41754.1 hypothetical protein CPATCC_002349 [Cryptosporidium parvum]
MFNMQFEGTLNYPKPNHSVKEMVKLFDIKSNDFNNTISTINSDSNHFEQELKTTKKKSNYQNNTKKIKKVLDPLQSSLYVIDQEHFEIFDPVYPSMTEIFQQRIKKKKYPKTSSKTNNINNKTLSNFSQNKYNNNHIINNYFNYLWQVGDEFSEIHCFPLF